MKSKVSFVILALTVVAVIFISGCVGEQPTQITPTLKEIVKKIVFEPPAKLPDATVGTPYSYSFCQPDSARSGATCGGLAGATTNPYGGNPPYSFSHQFGVGFIPPGLALELNGLLRGTPTLPGAYTFGICVTDLYEEVCKTTSLTVKPKSEETEEEQAKEEQIEKSTKEKVEEQITPSVKITSASATVIKCRSYGAYVRSCACTVKMSGTATLLLGGRVGAGSSAYEDFGYGDVVSVCPKWRKLKGGCERVENQPATSEWSVTFPYLFWSGEEYKQTFSAEIVGEEKKDSVTVTCSPQ